jgi:hypothetical protein
MKTIATVLAATMAICAVMASAAEARPRGPGYGHGQHGRVYGGRRGRGGNAGAAVALGVAGALIGGAAIAASNRNRRNDYYDGPGPGYPAYGPAPGYYDGY